MVTQTQTSTVKDAWKEYREFWNEYPQELDRMGIKNYKQLKARANEIIGFEDPSYDQVKEALKLVVHPKDYDVIVNDIKMQRRTRKKLTLTLLSKIKYATDSMGEYNTVKPDYAAEARPVIPEPFYGDPLTANIVTVFINPGLNDGLLSKRHKSGDKKSLEALSPDTVNNEESRQEVNLSHLRFDGKRLTENLLYPWESSDPNYESFRYYFKKLYSQKDNNVPTIVSRLLDRDLDKRVLFHADFIPYQSKNAHSAGIKQISRSNEEGLFLPSQKALMNLLSVLKEDRSLKRLIVFRNSKMADQLSMWLGYKFSTGVVFFRSSNASNVSLTEDNITLDSAELRYFFSPDVGE
ncbi:MAG: hypothetical protein Q4P05_05635 [Actinomycetaceae bacterium]|nr:hypothetical protein [Actinomycetaceae bacterium]